MGPKDYPINLRIAMYVITIHERYRRIDRDALY